MGKNNMSINIIKAFATANKCYQAGKYYSQSGKTYLCNRDTGNPVYHPLSALVGLYVTVVEVN